jgi:hypothetical protein
VAFSFKVHRIAKIGLVVIGVFVVAFAALLAYFADRIAHSQDPGTPERVAAQIANFTVPKGFRATHGLELPIMRQVTFVSTDPQKHMTIVLQGMYLSATREAMDQSLLTSMKSRCVKLLPLGDDLLTANGALFTLHRFSCVGAEGGKETYEYEFGSFMGKTPIATLVAFAPQTSWDPQPVHALLRSLH